MNSGLRQQIKSVEKKRRKATERQKKFVRKLRASAGERTILEIHSVKEPQRKEYSRRLEEFYNFVAFHNLSIRTEGELDIAMCDYADELFLDGEGCHVGEKLKAALEYERPEGIRSGQLMLPRFKRAMKGWRKLAPQQTRLPMMEFLKSCISGLMMDMGEREMSLFNETSFSTYARPGELLRLRPVDVVPRAPGHNFDVLILNPIERGETSKAGIFDETLILDDSRAPWLGELLNQLAARRSKEVGEGGQLWPFTARKYLETWRQCVRALEVEDVAETPYQNRHGGASRDHLLRLRSVGNIQRRGRWASDSSSRIYSKPGRLQQIVNQHGNRLTDFGENVRKNFLRWFHTGFREIPKQVRQKAQSSKRKHS